MNKRIIIMGATSGLGRACAEDFISRGYVVGVCGRRTEELEQIRAIAPERVYAATIDVTSPDADKQLAELIDRMGGMDIYFHVSGIGKNNIALNPDLELSMVRVNCEGFCRMVGAAYRYFRQNAVKDAQIAVISSIAGTKGLGAAPAYSATKRMQNCYIQSLAQQCAITKTDIAFTDIRPGFVATPLLDTQTHHYPMLMSTPYAARRIVRAILARRRVAVIDWRYAILVAVWRCIPRWLWERLPIKAAEK
ncbi:MAG: SDR family NAD(P)-dependent oxidoreductase [Rikenellaceae bacterium]|nr:SDR family NAD(P)-dependent oxidoreductase [Rikenellaceae bacterium]